MFFHTKCVPVVVILCQIVNGFNNEPKNINIGIFLDVDDNLTELAVKSAINILNLYSTVEYNINPIVYKISRNDVLKSGFIACEMLELGVAAIFGPNHDETNEIIQSMTAYAQIPQFQTYWNPNLDVFSSKLVEKRDHQIFNFNLYPNPCTLSRAIATLIRHNDWNTFTVIYENDEGLVKLQEALKARNPASHPPVTFRKLGRGPDHRSVLKEVQASGAFHIILDCDTDHIMDILLQAKEVKLLEEFHTYLLTSLDAHTLDFTQLNSKANITSIRLLNPSNLSMVAKDWVMNEADRNLRISPKSIKTKTALLYDAINLFISSFAELDKREELVVEPLSCGSHKVSGHGYRLAKYIAMCTLEKSTNRLRGPLSGPLAFNSYGQRSKFQLQVIELVKEEFRVSGLWDSNSPDRITATITDADREKEAQQSLQGRTFRVVSRIDPPYFIYAESKNGEKLVGDLRFEGYAVDLMRNICSFLKCNVTFEKVPDNKYGRYNAKTKEWDGLIKHLLDRKADMAICDLTITYERRKAVDFTIPFMTLGISILYAKAVKEPPELLSFTKPLSLDVWLYTATVYIIMSMLIFLTARMNPYEWENPHPCNQSPEELENIWNIKNCFWLTLGSIMQQGCDLLPKGISTRMVAGMWWFFSMLIIACYTANLAAFLTMDRMGPTINDAKDLSSQTKIKYGCLADGATAAFFKDTNFSTYHRMWVQMEGADPSVFVNTNKDGVKRVISSKGKYAFLMESTGIEYELQRNCELVQVGGWLDTKGYGIAMPINAPYRKSINHAILQMQERDTLKHLKDKWWKEKNEKAVCTEDKRATDPSTTELGLAHVGGVFVVLAGGVGVALLFAVIEFFWNVKKIAVTNHLKMQETLVRELKFAMNIRKTKKAIKPAKDESREDVTGKVK